LPERGDQRCRRFVPQERLAALLGPIPSGSGQCYKDVIGAVNETNHLTIQANLLDHVAKIDNCQRDDSDDVVRPFQAQWDSNRTQGRILKCLVERGHDLLLIKSVSVELNYRTVGEMEEGRQ
jgi:hypothetical protein